MADSLKTKQKYTLPDLEKIRDTTVKAFGEDLGRVLFNAFRDVYDDLKLLFTRLTRHQTLASTPAQLTANADNYDPGAAAFLRMSADAARDLTGISGGEDGRRLTLINVGSFTITLKHQSASSVAANRLLSATGADVALAANGIKELIYDATTARWRL